MDKNTLDMWIIITRCSIGNFYAAVNSQRYIENIYALFTREDELRGEIQSKYLERDNTQIWFKQAVLTRKIVLTRDMIYAVLTRQIQSK
jgi:hypothetical protein